MSESERETVAEAYISRRYYANSILTKEESDKLEPIQILPVSAVQGNVRYGAGLTINIGNFESVRVDVGITLPAVPEEMEDAMAVCVAFVDNKLTEQKAMLESLKN